VTIFYLIKVPEDEKSTFRDLDIRAKRKVAVQRKHAKAGTVPSSNKTKSTKKQKAPRPGHYEICKGPKRTLKYIPPVEERTCQICHEVLSRISGLRMHMNTKHTKAQVFPCEVCGKEFYTRESLRSHEGVHLSELEIRNLIAANSEP